jgi:chromosome partitioning protein
MRIITFCQSKGGVGKTTCAINLATAIAQENSVCLLDGDRNRSAKQWGSQGKLPYAIVDETEDIPATDYLVIDSAANIEWDDLRLLVRRSDLTILPSSMDDLAIGALFKTIAILRSDNLHKFQVLITFSPTNYNSTAFKDAVTSLAEEGIPTFQTPIRRYAAHTKAVSSGVAVRDLKGDRLKRKAWNDFVSLWQEVKEVLGEQV